MKQELPSLQPQRSFRQGKSPQSPICLAGEIVFSNNHAGD